MKESIVSADDWFVIKLSLFDEEFRRLINISSEFRLKYADVLKVFTAVKFVTELRNRFGNKPTPHTHPYLALGANMYAIVSKYKINK